MSPELQTHGAAAVFVVAYLLGTALTSAALLEMMRRDVTFAIVGLIGVAITAGSFLMACFLVLKKAGL